MNDIATQEAAATILKRLAPKRPSRAEAEAAVRTLIAWAGDDPRREGLGHPARVDGGLRGIFLGLSARTPPTSCRDQFEEAGGYDDLVMLRDIRVESHCEHHMAPFLGVAHVAYLPNGRIVGISKIARVVEIFAKRLQTQETMTAQIADAIEEALMPRGVAVLIEAEHQCMSMRGVRQPGVQDHHHALHGGLEYRAPATATASCRWCTAPVPEWAAGPMPTVEAFMTSRQPVFAVRGTPAETERRLSFQPKFDADGLIPAIVTDAGHGRGADVCVDECRGARPHAGDALSGTSGAARAASSGRRARRAAISCA